VHEPTSSPSRAERPPSSGARRAVALLGPGRAGRAVAAALGAAGWPVVAVAGRSIDASSTLAAAAELGAGARAVDEVGRGVDLIVVATPDDEIATVATVAVAAAAPGALVLHLAGSRGLEVFGGASRLRPDVRFAALHPLVSIPTPDPRHLAGGWCAIAGDPDGHDVAVAIGMQPFAIADEDRARYHAAASIAANHLVALLGQVERLAGDAGVPRAAFYPLVRGVIDNCDALGPRDALTGPVARGDGDTVARHLAALPPDERPLYRALAGEALRLSGRDDPDLAARLR
jgi:predicted short-subunit dehydrogenase-like oxidoreductase (DUF2520 family)